MLLKTLGLGVGENKKKTTNKYKKITKRRIKETIFKDFLRNSKINWRLKVQFLL